MVRNDNFIFMKQKSINWSYELKFLMYYFNNKTSYQKALPYCDARNNSVLSPQICPISHKENCENLINCASCFSKPTLVICNLTVHNR
ncbi:hypothetical protein CDAR_267711 [Caerostris darwini]|uniref:Uncharacterized protein n=1 Tax=Caerostris darwini TaxID=1538125 RepID=A0AAV4RP41_9ARAC|nr:hypothetical protein CDAR_267711 [Caerostris darwini]